MKTVKIPACAMHEGVKYIMVTIPWLCPECGAPRGEVREVISWDGSRRLGCDGWTNLCGHVDLYSDVCHEGANNV